MKTKLTLTALALASLTAIAEITINISPVVHSNGFQYFKLYADGLQIDTSTNKYSHEFFSWPTLSNYFIAYFAFKATNTSMVFPRQSSEGISSRFFILGGYSTNYSFYTSNIDEITWASDNIVTDAITSTNEGDINPP